jgi:hypothetical protein
LKAIRKIISCIYQTTMGWNWKSTARETIKNIQTHRNWINHF